MHSREQNCIRHDRAQMETLVENSGVRIVNMSIKSLSENINIIYNLNILYNVHAWKK